jgi:hypothetical protein
MRTRNRIIRGVAFTSKLSYREVLASGQIAKETDYILSLLKEVVRPMTSREMATRGGIERGNVTRTIYNLEGANLIKVAKCDKCPVTNKTVKYYVCNG